jgi:hypothetical protein
MKKFDSQIKSVAAKAAAKLREASKQGKVHDPYADLFSEINRMSSRDTMRRVS